MYSNDYKHLLGLYIRKSTVWHEQMRTNGYLSSTKGSGNLLMDKRYR